MEKEDLSKLGLGPEVKKILYYQRHHGNQKNKKNNFYLIRLIK